MKERSFVIAAIMPRMTMFVRGIDYRSSDYVEDWMLDVIENPNRAKVYNDLHDACRAMNLYKKLFCVTAPFIGVVPVSKIGAPSYYTIQDENSAFLIDKNGNPTASYLDIALYPIDEEIEMPEWASKPVKLKIWSVSDECVIR